ncbi:hypothetical protein IFM89_014644 [Coptis chinensis]|uniref:UmuC domain-containing protein n=1 Tax=Coptis chinensis TaxID=261450 RepID=A0A835H8D4_9MAGN|nr:hypothetical protein IFM89_014644 [Coptis chinensis]
MILLLKNGNSGGRFYGYGPFSKWYLGNDDSSLAELRKYYNEPRNLSGAGVVAGDGMCEPQAILIGCGFKHENPIVDASNVDQGTSVIHIDRYLEPLTLFYKFINNIIVGVKAEMFVRDAKALCPHLDIIPYNFEAYEVVANQFYDILHKHCNRVQVCTCLEISLNITTFRIDEEIFEATGGTPSAGVVANMLVARLATQTAKPNGQFFISPMKIRFWSCVIFLIFPSDSWFLLNHGDEACFASALFYYRMF